MDRITDPYFDLLIERSEGGQRARVINPPAGQASAGFLSLIVDLNLQAGTSSTKACLAYLDNVCVGAVG